MAKKSKDTLLGVLLVTHKDYGKNLLDAAEFILGPQPNVASIGVDASQDVQKTLQRIKNGIAELDQGSGVLILTDMFGGTPTNLSLSLLSSANLEVITGVNLPMLLKVLGQRDLSPREIAETAKKAGVQGIVVAGELLRKKTSDG